PRGLAARSAAAPTSAAPSWPPPLRRPLAAAEIEQDMEVEFDDGRLGVVSDVFSAIDEFWVKDRDTGELVEIAPDDSRVRSFKADELFAARRPLPAGPLADDPADDADVAIAAAEPPVYEEEQAYGADASDALGPYGAAEAAEARVHGADAYAAAEDYVADWQAPDGADASAAAGEYAADGLAPEDDDDDY
ncbi:unnamed protein product, partial [Prorocentrum cordatum]